MPQIPFVKSIFSDFVNDPFPNNVSTPGLITKGQRNMPSITTLVLQE